MNHDETATVRPLTLVWVSRHLEAGERIVKAEALHGGITAEMRRLIIGTRDGGTRDLVLRSYVDPFYMENAEDGLIGEAGCSDLARGDRRAKLLHWSRLIRPPRSASIRRS